MQIIITDVTEMSAGRYCVAGWCLQQGVMVRPLPNGANWAAATLHVHGVQPGAIIEVIENGAPYVSDFPHRTEDTPIEIDTIRLLERPPFAWNVAGGPIVRPTLNDIFGGQLITTGSFNGARKGAHVPLGAEVASLGALNVPRNSVILIEDFGRLKAVISDRDERYQLPVSSAVLKDAFRAGGLIAARQAVPNTPRLHLRVGLARAYEEYPDRCYVMLNGVHG